MSQKHGYKLSNAAEAALFKRLSDVDSLIDKAGEWDLSITGEIPVSSLPKEMDTFLTAFPWLIPRKVTVAIAGTPAFFTWSGDPSLQEWLTSLTREGVTLNGLEATLDAEVDWPLQPEGVQRVTLPKAVELILGTFHPEAPFYSVSIWPNVFTDLVYDYEQPADPETGLALRPFNTARTNRTQLRTSLQQWESLTGGHISGWDSDTIEGVECSGFSEDAQVR